MNTSRDKIWYGCYGSNLLEERFLCYIAGGQPRGSAKIYEGCRDKTVPSDNEDFYITSELYFAKEAKESWNGGGVAFIRTNFDAAASTLGRLYLITKDQFVDVARQETNTKGEVSLNFEEAIRKGNYIFKQPSWYGNLVYLGEHNGYPIFTLTNEQDVQPFTKPSIDYLKKIVGGIKESHGFGDLYILDYLKQRQGIAGNYTSEELLEIIKGVV